MLAILKGEVAAMQDYAIIRNLKLTSTRADSSMVEQWTLNPSVVGSSPTRLTSYICQNTLMIYVALLRGINVGGNNKVEMKRLKEVFEKAGHLNVSTYINSGNVIFESKESNSKKLAEEIEKIIEKEFGFNIKVLVKSLTEIKLIEKELPSSWQNDLKMKCDVMFLWEEVDNKKVLDGLTIKKGIDEVIYIKGALLWSIQRSGATRSGIAKLVGTNLYKQMTIRNCNTLRKLFSLMKALDDLQLTMPV